MSDTPTDAKYRKQVRLRTHVVASSEDYAGAWRLHLAHGNRGPDRRHCADVAKAIIRQMMSARGLRHRVVVGDDDAPVEVGDPLGMALSEFFGRFGYNAGCEALAQALYERTANRPGRPPKALSAARVALEPHMRGRGNARGRSTLDPDHLAARDQLWLLLYDRMIAAGAKPMDTYRAVARAEGLTVHRVKTHLNRLRHARSATPAVTPQDINW